MLKGGMDRRRTNIGGLLALVATLFAVFVMVPIASAANCGSHAGSASAEMMIGDPAPAQGEEGDPGPGHCACAQSECKHASASLCSPTREPAKFAQRGAAVSLRPELDPVSHAPDGLKRPPRN